MIGHSFEKYLLCLSFVPITDTDDQSTALSIHTVQKVDIEEQQIL